MGARAALKRLRPGLGEDLKRVVRASARHRWSRAALNYAYRRLSFANQASFHGRFSRVFCGVPPGSISGDWRVTFAGREVRIPLRPAHAWLDWDAALSLLGHEIEVKQTYAALLQSPERPEVFVDIGTNVGTHSLMHLVNGLSVVSFEPNPDCHEPFLAWCQANGVHPRIEPVALGAAPGIVTLRYPKGETWLGTVDLSVSNDMAAHRHLEARDVTVKTLDEFLPTFAPGRMLVKIDTEGNELQVLLGARSTLRARRPWILFESWRAPARRQLYDLLVAEQYTVSRLPWTPSKIGHALTLEEFLQTDDTNFVAAPTVRPSVSGVSTSV